MNVIYKNKGEKMKNKDRKIKLGVIVGLILVVVVFGLTGCQIRGEKTLKNVSSKYKKIAIVDVTFDSRIFIGPRGEIPLKAKKLKASRLKKEDIAFLQKSAEEIIQEFEKGKKFQIQSGETVVSHPIYQSIKRDTKNRSSYEIAPYSDLKLKKREAKKLCKALNVDAIASIRFAYFYAFRRTVLDIVNPINWVKGFSLLIGGTPEPNSMGLVMYINLHNKKGKKILGTSYYVMLRKGKKFNLPGYLFHLYPESKEYTIKATELMKESIARFQTQDGGRRK
jgi:hypothetical protein